MREREIKVRQTDISRYLSVMSNIRRKIVCVDIDNTIANTNTELERMGHDVKKYPNPKLGEDFWFSREGLTVLTKAEPIRETMSVVRLMDKLGAEIIFATARHIALARITEEWLARYRLAKPVFYVHSKLLAEADVYIEDSPAEIRRLLQAGLTVLVPEWPYNNSFDSSNLIHYMITGGNDDGR
jgi:uncharacterized HAD superfamily protein